MILFKPEHIDNIISGRKTETRRGGKRRWNVGVVRQCQTRMMDSSSVFCRVEILSVDRERLGDITDAGVRAEGYETMQNYYAAWERINGRIDLDEKVWVVKFRLTK